jgi:O-antigen/teichoic acid export membrane protein
VKLGAAIKWTFFAVGSRYAIKLLGNLTLARLLPAEAFGLASIVFAVVTSIEAITDVGTKPALIRSERTDPDWLDTAWTLGVARGLFIGVCIAGAAIPLSAFFGDARLEAMIAVTGIMSVLAGLTSNEAILAVRGLQAKALALTELFTAIVGYAVMLIWAWLFPSAWALLAGTLVSTGVFTVLSYFAFSRRTHRLRWDPGALSELIKFGKWIFLSSILGIVILQGDRFATGKLLGITELGVYSIAVTWASSLQALFGVFLSRLYLPVVAEFRRRLGDFNAASTKLRRNVLGAMVIPFAFAAGCSEQIIVLLYPDAFAGAGPVMRILVVGAWFAILEHLYNDQLMVSGYPAWRSAAQAVSILVMGTGLLMLSGNYELEGIAAVVAGGAAVRAILLMIANNPRRLSAMIPDVLLTIGLLIISAIFAYLSNLLASNLSPAASLGISVAVLAPIGAVVLWSALRSVFRLAPETKEPTITDPRIQDQID